MSTKPYISAVGNILAQQASQLAHPQQAIET
jgi:hypothetical protein